MPKGQNRKKASDDETMWHNGTLKKPPEPSLHDRGTKSRVKDGINKPIPLTQMTRFPDPWGKS